MLDSLTIRQIALIEEAAISFHDGMQVLTGETGAGKSIVVDSVNLVLGGRADRELIRSGSEKASVEAVFSVPDNDGVRAFMEREGIDFDGNTVTVYREISAAGKNICRICGILLPVTKLKELSGFLMDLHGQSEHQFLSDPDRHLAFLDQTGGEKHRMLLKKVREDYDSFITNHRMYAKLIRQNNNREGRLASLQRDIEELRKAEIRKGEAAQLAEKRKQLEKAEKEEKAIRTVAELLAGADGNGGLSCVKLASDMLKSLAAKDESVRTVSERCESLYYELEDVSYQISMKMQHTGFEPGALEKTDNRLDLIHRLERKHGTDADLIPELLTKMEEEYCVLSDLEDEIERMSSEHKKLLSRYRNTARELTESRKNLASDFELHLMNELSDLGMGNTLFKVHFVPNESGRPVMPTENGDDKIEFMITPNPGEPLKPLSRIVSGGELSRLMLAFKSMESVRTGVDAMVFDEIDTGISGRMAQVVAEKMIAISRQRQVICVTHLPQLAAAADYQYLVHKSVSEGRTRTSVVELDRKGRVKEVSRMISGADGITAESDSFAEKLLKAAAELKQSL